MRGGCMLAASSCSEARWWAKSVAEVPTMTVPRAVTCRPQLVSLVWGGVVWWRGLYFTE